MDFTRGHHSRTRQPVVLLLLLLLLILLCVASLHFQQPKEKDFARLDSRREDECSNGFAKARASWAETETIIQSRLPLGGADWHRDHSPVSCCCASALSEDRNLWPRRGTLVD